jgi:SAM-dependent methyltransferase
VFTESARFYDALYAFKDYGAAVTYLRGVLDEAAPQAASLLDVGCGTGRHLQLLRDRYEVEGLDVNPALLEVARERCPSVPLHEADMADFRLDGRFDVVTCLFSAIAYVRTLERMRSAVSRMRTHLNPGGVLLVEPWFTPDTYWTGTITANQVDQDDLRLFTEGEHMDAFREAGLEARLDPRGPFGRASGSCASRSPSRA